MKKYFLLVLSIPILMFGCKDLLQNSSQGNFRLINKSDKVVEFVWIAPEGEFYPTAQSIDIGKDQIYETQGLDSGLYDIAIDFKGEFNSINSKKNKKFCVYIDKGLTTVWHIQSDGTLATE